MSHATESSQEIDVRIDGTRIRWFCAISCVVGSIVVLLSIVFEVLFVGHLTAATLCGMAETRGRCGMSHVGMIAPHYSEHRALWFKCCSAYSLCGLVTAYLTGLVIASIGSIFDLGSSVYFLAVACLMCSLVVLRELGVVQFTAPQCDRQTDKQWAQSFGMITGAGMWGAHIGIGITTVIMYGGMYCVLLAVFGLGIGAGEWIMVSFWLGRIVPHWLTPLLVNKTSNGSRIFSALNQSSGLFRATACCGMVSILCVLVATMCNTFV